MPLTQAKDGQNRGSAYLFLSLFVRFSLGGSLCLLLTSCPEEKDNEDDLYDPRNVTRINNHLEVQPDLALDSEGSVHMVYHGSIYEDPREVWYTKRTDEGVWIEPVNLSNSASNSRKPQIAIDSHDRIHIVWQEDGDGMGRTKYTNKTADGEWLSPTFITENGNPLPQIFIDGNDDVHMAGMGYSIYGTYRKTTDGVWGDIQQVYSNMNPALAVSYSGDAHVVHNVYSLWHFFRNSTGEWSEQFKLDDNTNWPFPPDIAVWEDGSVYVAWATKYTDQVKLRVRHPDGNWSETDSIPDLEGSPWTVQVEVDNNAAHLVWNAHTEEGDFDIYYQMRRHDGKWLERANISVTPGASLDHDTLFKDGILHIAWAEKFEKPLTSNADIYFTIISIAD